MKVENDNDTIHDEHIRQLTQYGHVGCNTESICNQLTGRIETAEIQESDGDELRNENWKNKHFKNKTEQGTGG